MYSWIRTKVGLVTTRPSATPRPKATARTRCVLPAPSGPIRATTAPGKSRPASCRPNASVAAKSGRSIVIIVFRRPLGGGVAGLDALELFAEIGALRLQRDGLFLRRNRFVLVAALELDLGQGVENAGVVRRKFHGLPRMDFRRFQIATATGRQPRHRVV